MSKTKASRKATTSPLRRLSQCVLAVGAILSVSAAFGPIWVVRSGIALAVIGGILACVFAWREVAAQRRANAVNLLEVTKAQTSTLTDERKHNASVVDALVKRSATANTEVERSRVTVAELHSKISTLHGDKAFLQGEIKQREATIVSLRDTVRAREAELIALDGEEGAEIHPLPRRVLAEHELIFDEAADGDLWSDGGHPTVVDLRTLETAHGMPNYEAERKSS